MSRLGEPAPAQVDPDQLLEGDYWTYGCPEVGCATATQGGWGGLLAHLNTVHPDREHTDLRLPGHLADRRVDS